MTLERSTFVKGALVLAAMAASGCAADLATVPAAEDDGGVGCQGPSCARPGMCRPGQASAQFRSQSALPGVVTPSTRLPMEVTFTNCSGLYWNREDFSLVPVDPEEGAAWGVRRVGLPIEVPNGTEVTVRFELVAPLGTGHYPARFAISRRTFRCSRPRTARSPALRCASARRWRRLASWAPGLGCAAA